MKRFVWVLALAWWLWPPAASAVIEVIPTLGQVINDATHIVVLEVEKVSLEKRVIIYKKLADLKGKHPTERVHESSWLDASKSTGRGPASCFFQLFAQPTNVDYG